MNIDDYVLSEFTSKTFSQSLLPSKTDSILNPQSPASSNQNLPDKTLDNLNYTDSNFFKSLYSNSSLTKIKPHSSNSDLLKNLTTLSSPSTSLNKPSLTNQTTEDLSNILGKTLQSNKLNTDQPLTFQFKSKVSSPPVETSPQKNSYEYYLLKIENKKLNETVGKLRKQLEEKVSTLQKFNQLMKIKYSELKELKTKLQEKQTLIQDLQKNLELQKLTPIAPIDAQQVSNLKELLMRKNKQLDEINAKINGLEHENFKNEIFQSKISKLNEELEEERTKVNESLLEKSVASQKIKQLEEHIAVLQFEKQKMSIIGKVSEIEQIQNLFKNNNEFSPTKNNKQSTHLTAFEEALKVQMKQIEELKQVIDNSSELVQKLRDNLVTSRRQIQQLRGQMKILDLKASSERKKIIVQYRLQIHEKDNEINSHLKRLKTLEEKYKNSLLDIKAKDHFFKQYLVGRTTEPNGQNSIETILQQYTEDFDGMIQLKTENQALRQKLEKYQKFEEEIEKAFFEGNQKPHQ